MSKLFHSQSVMPSASSAPPAPFPSSVPLTKAVSEPVPVPVPHIDLFAPPYNAELAEERRDVMLTRQHSIPEKMDLYNCSTQGRLAQLTELLADKGFSPTEEVSKEGHFWTVLHYACHYGHADVVVFLLEFLARHEEFHQIMNMQTIEGKTPIFCAILSGDIKPALKKDIIKMLFETGQVDLTLRKSSGEDVLELARKNQLYDFIVLQCLRED